MKKFNFLTILIIIATSIITLSMSASAITMTTPIDIVIYADKSIEEDVLSVTVPAVLPIIFESNGSTTTPKNFEIKNLGSTNVGINNIYLETTNSGWDIHQVENDTKPGEYFLNKGNNFQTIEMLVGEIDKEKVSIGTIENENRIVDLNITIDAAILEEIYNSTILDFDVYRTIFTKKYEVENAFILVVEFSII